MTDEPSPWPERRRTQHALFAAGGLLLAVVALALAEVVAMGGAHVVLVATVASLLLVYGLLGAAGRWIPEEELEDPTAGDPDGADPGADDDGSETDAREAPGETPGDDQEAAGEQDDEQRDREDGDLDGSSGDAEP